MLVFDGWIALQVVNDDLDMLQWFIKETDKRDWASVHEIGKMEGQA